jgi:recombination protein RecA
MPSLADTLEALNKAHGSGSVVRLGDKPQEAINVIPSGSIALDAALGVGGFPRGRIVEVYGPESSGKTTIALHAIAQAQAAGGTCAFIDAEHALDPGYAAAVGVDTGQLLLSQPDSGEQALEIVDHLTRTGEVTLIVVDSVAALVPRAELEGEMGDSHVGLHARLMSQAMRKIAGPAEKTGTTVLFINQLRVNIGQMGYGTPETTTGGKALRFYASIRLDVRRIQTEKEKEEATGNRTRVKVVKNKLAAPHKQAELTIEYGHGINRERELVEFGAAVGVVNKSGNWYSYGDIKLGNGLPAAVRYLRANPEVSAELEGVIK